MTIYGSTSDDKVIKLTICFFSVTEWSGRQTPIPNYNKTQQTTNHILTECILCDNFTISRKGGIYGPNLMYELVHSAWNRSDELHFPGGP